MSVLSFILVVFLGGVPMGAAGPYSAEECAAVRAELTSASPSPTEFRCIPREPFKSGQPQLDSLSPKTA